MPWPDPPEEHGAFEESDIGSWWTEPPVSWIDHFQTAPDVSFNSGLPAVPASLAYWFIRETSPYDDPDQSALLYAVTKRSSFHNIGFYQRNQGRFLNAEVFGPMALRESVAGILGAYTAQSAIQAAWILWRTVGASAWGYTIAEIRTLSTYTDAKALEPGYVPGVPPGAEQPIVVAPGLDAGWNHFVNSVGRNMPGSAGTVIGHSGAIRSAIS